MNKKHDLPAMPFYFGDWRKAPEIRALPLDVRMVWLEMLGFMWESTERGYLTINGQSIPNECLARMLGIDEVFLDFSLKKLELFDVFSRRKSDGAIYSRKMVRDESLRKIRKKAGSLGGNKRVANCLDFAQAKPQANTEYETEDENEEDNTSLVIRNNKNKTHKKTKLTDEEFIETLKTSDAYKHFDVHKELAKMDAWLMVNSHRQKTRRFVVGWLNRIEKPMGGENGNRPNKNQQAVIDYAAKHGISKDDLFKGDDNPLKSFPER